jgi:hypothetical protein
MSSEYLPPSYGQEGSPQEITGNYFVDLRAVEEAVNSELQGESFDVDVQLGLDRLKYAETTFRSKLGLSEQAASRLTAALLMNDGGIADPEEDLACTTLELRQTVKAPERLDGVGPLIATELLNKILDGQVILLANKSIRFIGHPVSEDIGASAVRFAIYELDKQNPEDRYSIPRLAAVFEISETQNDSWYVQVTPFATTELDTLNQLEPQARVHAIAMADYQQLKYGEQDE